MSATMIAAVDENWAIGNRGELLISIPEDQKGVFKKYTTGNTVVFGRKTLLTFPGQRLLPGRTNIILTRNHSFTKDGAVILHGKDELFYYMKEHPDEKIFIIGGQSVYESMQDLCDYAIITFIHKSFEADAFFPRLDLDKNWQLYEEEETVESKIGVSFNVRHYRRILTDGQK